MSMRLKRNLTKTEQAVFNLLRERNAATREEILKDAIGWENPETADTRTVDVTISRIRKALPKYASIKAVYGVGYKAVGFK